MGMTNPCTYLIQTYSFKPKGNGLEVRKEKFKKRVWIAIGKTFEVYPKKMCEEFISYWTEHNELGKKMRFEYKDNMWYEDNQMIWMEEFEDGFDLIDPDNVTVITNRALKYVHQLQNLYFALTGKAL